MPGSGGLEDDGRARGDFAERAKMTQGGVLIPDTAVHLGASMLPPMPPHSLDGKPSNIHKGEGIVYVHYPPEPKERLPGGKDTVLVTGATGGLGFDLSTNLMTSHYNVASLTRGRKKGRAGELAATALGKGVLFFDHNVDLSRWQEVQKRLSELIPNPKVIRAAVFAHGSNYLIPLLDLDIETIEESMRENFYGSLVLSQYMIKNWIEGEEPNSLQRDHRNKDRVIIFVGSVATHTASPEELAYHIAKAAQIQTMKSIVRQYSPYGIRSLVVAPGMMDTEMGRMTMAQRPETIERIPLKVLVATSSIAQIIKTAIENEYWTGDIINIHSGRAWEATT